MSPAHGHKKCYKESKSVQEIKVHKDEIASMFVAGNKENNILINLIL
jgi:hypothetical protein